VKTRIAVAGAGLIGRAHGSDAVHDADGRAQRGLRHVAHILAVDQYAAGKIRDKTPLPSLELGIDRGANAGNCDSGYSCAYSNTICWSSPTTPLPPEINPRAVFERINPLANVAKIKKPMLVMQGANDPRVLKVESDEIVAAAKKNGVAVEYIVFPDEGHGFAKKDNADYLRSVEAYFLKQALGVE